MKCLRCGQWMAICDCTPEELNLMETNTPPLQDQTRRPTFKTYRTQDNRLVFRNRPEAK